MHASADTRGDLNAAKQRMRALEEKITAQEDAVDRVQSRLTSLAANLDGQERDLELIRRKLMATRIRLTQTKARHDELRSRIARRARAAYIQGPMSIFGLILNARSLADLGQRVTYVGRLVRQDADVTFELRKVAAQIADDEAEQTRLARDQSAKVLQLRRDERSLQATFAQQQSQLASLASDRAELAGLIGQLQDQLAAEELSRARTVAGRGMPITFGEWAQAFLRALGAPVVRSNLVAVVAWETAEYTRASWNPLATTYSMPGATNFNAGGVKNYTSMEQGIEASIATLRRPRHGYEAILDSLAKGNDAMTTARAINASDWCRGCAGGNYVVSLIPAVEAYYDRYASR